MSVYEHVAGVWHTGGPRQLRVRNILDGDGRVAVQICERTDGTWGVWDGHQWIVDRVTMEDAWQAASRARWCERDDIPVVSPGLRHLVLGTLWTVATIAVVAWRISDGLPLTDGIVAGTLMATWPWAVIWLADRTDLEDLR